jgi:hypothetical protein
MCDPITALSIASSVAGVVAQQQAADAQEAANQRQYEAAMRARAANLNQSNLQMSQEREAAVQKLEENNLKARGAAGAARVAAGESGVSGLSVDALLADLGNNQNRYNSSVVTNYDRSMGAIENQRQNIQASAESTINSLKTPAAPDYLGTALRIGNTVYDYDKKQNNGKWFGK